MLRLARSLGYVVVVALVARVAWPGEGAVAAWLPGVAAAVVGVAFGLERLAATDGRARWAPTGLAFGVLAAAAAVVAYGARVDSVPMLLAGVAGAAVAVPLAGLVLEAFPGPDRRAHMASGVVGLCALLPLGVWFLPGWLHPVTHWNPLFWLQHTFFRAHWSPEALAASGIRQPASFDWEYPLVPVVEAAVYGWFLARRIRERARRGVV